MMTTNSTVFRPRLSLAQLKAKLASEQDALAASRNAGGNLSLSEAMARQKHQQKLTDSIAATAREIALIESKGQREAEVRRHFAEIQEQSAAVGKDIEKAIDRRKALQADLDTAERKVKTLSKSKATSELRVAEERQLDVTLNEIGRLRNQIRLADEEITTLKARQDSYAPAYHSLVKELETLDDARKLDELSAAVDRAITNQTQLDLMHGEAMREVTRCQFLLQAERNRIDAKHRDAERNDLFLKENERRRSA
jgi:chromosome segregation ATPase